MKHHLDEEDPDVSKKRNESYTRNRELTTVVAFNLPKSYNQGKVRRLFRDCGVISHIDVCESADKNYRLARVEFTRYDEALSALTKSHKQIGNNEIEVTMLENSTLWITNFPPRFNHREIRALFNSIGVTVLSVRLPSLRYNANRRFAYVDVSRTQEVEKALTLLNSKEVEGYTLVIKQSNPLEKTKRTDASVWERREILIRHLDSNKVTEDSLRQHYSKYGKIEHIKIPKKYGSDVVNTYAFISFSDQNAAHQALETNGTQFEGNEISVTLADRKAYLERQDVKKLLNKTHPKDSDHIVSLFPLSDKVNKIHIQQLLQERASINENDIRKIYLITDLHGSLIILKDQKIAAKCSLALNGISFQNSTIQCGTISDLRNSTKKPKNQEYKQQEGEGLFHLPEHQPTKKQLSNDDFRKMFLGK
ncbi:hypothetical protein ZYGR_0AD03320 [Zygosaccharomyces rouxii]|uniref:ZYRO0G13706p n=2 Tax=Zygosaccharomyces rouxii TaxID=4956 RepID=C5E0L4_ZYGRC|nr:uncharacterized protein ZYRO0G13706g [Zygosaccharomyces rouxii]KAH9202642.1 hypothetical protein LQ764DRAFT_36112 [Zygosaccharomyces rouxii]GAV51149.1 hypothetical protein ZYGR_0AD03320 [Zygosaccharomyces rouxii]CAR29648.1 ZYRO0G13706p [Zygosaccharomyces rouxii]